MQGTVRIFVDAYLQSSYRKNGNLVLNRSKHCLEKNCVPPAVASAAEDAELAGHKELMSLAVETRPIARDEERTSCSIFVMKDVLNAHDRRNALSAAL
jgi:hypothetical protein